ncbi:MAG: glycosyl hydrolase family 31 [Bacteroidales bacterium]|nr:glycosyl hydrolase family 31 [Bacteroidales bacterium]
MPEGASLQEELVYTEKVQKPHFKTVKTETGVELSTASLTARYSKADGTLTFLDAAGEVLLSEIPGGRKVESAPVKGHPAWSVSQRFRSPEDEALFGTGQFQDGYLNVRGLTRRLTQVNTQIALPFLLSNKGYGLLWNNYGLTDFNPADNAVALEPEQETGHGETVNATGTAGNRRERRWYQTFTGELNVPVDGLYAILLDCGQAMSRRQFLSIDDEPVFDVTNTWLPPTTSAIVTLPSGRHTLRTEGVRGDKPVLYWSKVEDETAFRSPVAQALDYTVFAGDADEVISAYRKLTGPVPQMPEWMFGYIHCRERYHSQDEILENAAEFKRRGLPLDVIVQDWQWWGNTGWNSMVFDAEHYPDPRALTDSLHKDNVHLMLSVWSKVDHSTALGQKLEEKGYYIDGTDWIDFFQPEAADFYARSFRDSLAVPYGIDAWWFDATEPENDDLAGRLVGPEQLPGEFYRNVYPLMVNSTMYDKLRDLYPEEPVILTRSAFPGIQRYGVVTWSGDVGNDLETLRRQIAGGLGQMACGLPWWTFDAGGFFRPGDQYTSAEYQERLVRWVQVATFLPFMRVHGYMSQTEPWRYSEETLGILSSYMELREKLRPYILECAKRVSQEGYTLFRPMVFDFADDPDALSRESQFMFGPSLLVNPVLEAGAELWTTYLPAAEGGWTDFWTGEHYDDRQWIQTDVDLRTIPVFVRSSELANLLPH